jgi:hypothetical protein
MRRQALVHGLPDEQGRILRPKLTVALADLLRLAYRSGDPGVPGQRQIRSCSKRSAIRLRTQQGRTGGNNGRGDGCGCDRASGRVKGVP